MVVNRVVAALLLFALISCDGGSPVVPPVPTPPPTPEPTPPPVLTYRVRPIYAPCCDDPTTPGDEGFARGWPVATPEHITEVFQWSQGAVVGIVFRTGPYVQGIGGEYPVYVNGQFPDWSRLREAVMHANSLGMQGVIDIADAWSIKVSNRNPTNTSCADTRRGPPNDLYIEHTRQVVEATADLGVIYETGNELWLCNPSRAWEQAIVDTIRAHAPLAPVGSNARTGATVDYLASHGWPGMMEPPLPFGGHWTESDQRILRVEDVDLFVELWETQQVTTTIWPGQTPNSTLQRVLGALVEVE